MRPRAKAATFLEGLKTFGDLSVALHRDLHTYAQAHYSAYRRPDSNGSGLPVYWRALPALLAKRWLRNDQKAFLRDTILAQRMLYLAIRIQDDIVDGQTVPASLVFASDQLIVESQALFSKYFPNESKFWTVYRDCLRTTTQSIIEVDRIEESPDGNPQRLLDLHAKVCSIFKIGSAAVCTRAHRWQAFHRISVFCDQLAKAGQIIDDLIDLPEDLTRKRYNYVAKFRNWHLRKSSSGGNQWIHALFRTIDRLFLNAENTLKPLKINEARELVVRYRALAAGIHNSYPKSRLQTLILDSKIPHSAPVQIPGSQSFPVRRMLGKK